MNQKDRDKARARTRAIIHRVVRKAIEGSDKEQQEIALAAGVSDSYISLLVHGKRTPSFETLSDILAVCGRRLRVGIDRPDK